MMTVVPVRTGLVEGTRMVFSPTRMFLAGTAALLMALPATANDLPTLLQAVTRGDQPTVKTLLKTVKVNAKKGDGTTALAVAAYQDDLPMVDLLIRAGADVNLANDYGVSPLSLACQNANEAMVDRLLAAGADPNQAQWSGETPLMTCAAAGAVEATKQLLAKGADPNAAEKEHGQTPLMWAASSKQPRIVMAMIEHRANVNARSKIQKEPEPFVVAPSVSAYDRNYPPTTRFRRTSGGFTPILFAAQQGDIETVAALLAAGADINDRTEEEGTVLLVAIASGHEKLAAWLINKGADPNAVDANGITALHFALMRGLHNLAGMKVAPSDRVGWIRDNMPEIVKMLLDKGANPNAKIKNSLPFLDDPFIGRTTEDFHQVDMTNATPFLLAAVSGDVACMRMLLDKGADPFVETIEGVNALMLAAGLGPEKGRAKEASQLEAAKLAVQLKININKAKDDGRTALHAAVVQNWPEMVKFLVANGADLTARDFYGQTALTIAMGDPEDRIYRPLEGGNFDDRFRNTRENPRMTALLLELGAPPFDGVITDKSAR